MQFEIMDNGNLRIIPDSIVEAWGLDAWVGAGKAITLGPSHGPDGNLLAVIGSVADEKPTVQGVGSMSREHLQETLAPEPAPAPMVDRIDPATSVAVDPVTLPLPLPDDREAIKDRIEQLIKKGYKLSDEYSNRQSTDRMYKTLCTTMDMIKGVVGNAEPNPAPIQEAVPAPAPEVAPVAAQPAPAPAPAPVPAQVPAELTLEETLRQAKAMLAHMGNDGDIVAANVCSAMGVSKVREITTDRYPEFLERIRQASQGSGALQ